MSTNLKYFQLLAQIEKNPLRPMVARAFDLASDFKLDVERVAANRNWSEQGRASERNKNLTRALRDLRDMQKPLDEYHSKTETMRAAVKRPAYDKADVVGAMLRREIRDASRAMTFGQRAAHLAGPTRSKAFVDALLEFDEDPWMSGVDVFNPNELQVFEAAKLERLRDLHGPLLDTIAERDSTESEAMMIINVARNDVQAASGLEPVQFNEFAKPIESRQNAPWILEDKKTICEVINGKPVYHLASEDELRDGRQYPGGLSEYLAARAA